MKRVSTLFLRATVIGIGAIVLALCIFALPPMWAAVPEEYPEITYVFYGILFGMYAAAVPFFIALRQTLKLLSYIDKNKAFSELSVKALKRITYCAVTIFGLFVAILPFFYIWAEKDDAPGLIIIGMILATASLAVGVFAAVLKQLLGAAIAIKSENDLTV
jgi:hypothetical protein